MISLLKVSAVCVKVARFKTVSLSPEERELLQDYLDWAAKLAAKEHKRLANSAIDPDLRIVAAEDGLVVLLCYKIC